MRHFIADQHNYLFFGFSSLRLQVSRMMSMTFLKFNTYNLTKKMVCWLLMVEVIYKITIKQTIDTQIAVTSFLSTLVALVVLIFFH